ncbi:MAG: DUF1653 domain-containing protein [Candidatus Uhrbacteria bacterium]|nr:DUF1653 domain-containing protein [Candidatus Uhrbacteria bacterium]
MIKLGVYRHFKGNEYDMIGFAKDCDTLEPVVMYRARYGEHETWVRPLASFTEVITRDGVTQLRFEKIEE